MCIRDSQKLPASRPGKRTKYVSSRRNQREKCAPTGGCRVHSSNIRRHTLHPVSYTHLDVYKRQSEDHVERVKDVIKVGDEITARVIKVDSIERRIGLSIKAVSYTHLKTAGESV